MELWIRSQDKDSLINVEKIELIYDYLCCDDIQLIHVETDKGRIGSYSTQERALEVLDEIQNKIKPQSVYKEYHNEIKDGKNKSEFELVMTPKESTIEFIEPHTIIYEMPKE